MSERMIGIRVAITRYVSDDQPGFVECEFLDAHGHRWVFVEKIPIVTCETLDDRTRYPRPGVIACTVVGRRPDAARGQIILVSTQHPDYVESVDGVDQFEVLPTALIQWEWGSTIERAWDGCD
jgi:hypothetical protein